MNPVLQTRNLTYQYPQSSAHGSQQPIQFPDLLIEAAGNWLILGKSGSGKTTLLSLLAGIMSPTQGDVQVLGESVYALSNAQRDRFRGQHIGLVFQRSHLMRSLTVYENLLLSQQLAGVPKDEKRIRYLLESLHIAHKQKALPGQLSVGEQQRAAIARALVNKPALLLADEPSSALDDENCAAVIELLQKEAQEVQATLLVVTHDRRLTTVFPNQIHLV